MIVMPMLDYRLVEAFAAVVEAGGFEKAAKRLHITQSAVSQRVKQLEESTGCILLVRSSPPKPTVAGQEMLRHYRQVSRLEEDLSAGIGQPRNEFSTLPVAVNADSLATWFLPAVRQYMQTRPVLLDLRVEDQDKTHTLLRNGDVLGCISSRAEAFQGCRVKHLGTMRYRLVGTPDYQTRWYPDSPTPEAATRAPMLIFNRHDTLHDQLFERAFGHTVPVPAAYAPSAARFPDFIASGTVAGMIPEEQSRPLIDAGTLVDLFPDVTVDVRLHWHCWNIESPMLEDFGNELAAGAKREMTRC
ncbi:LysR family transcriptional regulator ArgP [Salidesulfovibrio brasiliensis]